MRACKYCLRYTRLHTEARAITCALGLYRVDTLDALKLAVEAEMAAEGVHA